MLRAREVGAGVEVAEALASRPVMAGWVVVAVAVAVEAAAAEERAA